MVWCQIHTLCDRAVVNPCLVMLPVLLRPAKRKATCLPTNRATHHKARHQSSMSSQQAHRRMLRTPSKQPAPRQAPPQQWHWSSFPSPTLLKAWHRGSNKIHVTASCELVLFHTIVGFARPAVQSSWSSFRAGCCGSGEVIVVSFVRPELTLKLMLRSHGVWQLCG